MTVNNNPVYVLQTGMSTVWSSGALVMLMEASTRLSSPTKWARQLAMPIYTSQVQNQFAFIFLFLFHFCICVTIS